MQNRTFLLVLVGFGLVQSALPAFNSGFEPKIAEGSDLTAIIFVMPEVIMPRESLATFPKKARKARKARTLFLISKKDYYHTLSTYFQNSQ